MLARRVLSWSRLHHLEVTYEDLIKDRTHFRQIVDFLSIDSMETAPESPLVKIRQGGPAETVLNFDEVRDVLSKSRFCEFIQ